MHYDVGIILGHYNSRRFGFSSRQIKRLNKGLGLYKNNQVKYLMPTGGVGFFNKTPTPLSQLSKQYFVEKGVPENRIFTEDKSTNTIENAQFALKIIQENKLKSALVITSADHMPRAKIVFNSIFPKNIQLDFVISDYWSGIWSIWDGLWHTAGWIKYGFEKMKRVKAKNKI